MNLLEHGFYGQNEKKLPASEIYNLLNEHIHEKAISLEMMEAAVDPTDAELLDDGGKVYDLHVVTARILEHVEGLAVADNSTIAIHGSGNASWDDDIQTGPYESIAEKLALVAHCPKENSGFCRVHYFARMRGVRRLLIASHLARVFRAFKAHALVVTMMRNGTAVKEPEIKTGIMG
ncbi:hypothetical protein NA57DRAFT_72598 [Rhizodiscina lignyota]|uniref:Uncharacterized protein n=1 Tax=Rhizodiscina lignyota TaxID=1504668 RepID=A0A9P4IM25_9PEZI|nr:hypothetical protein NA57DRAFT_72598 [Rhizodiscina lignyota]